MIFRSKERINHEIEIQYQVDSYKIIITLYNIVAFHFLATNKRIKLFDNIIKCLKEANIIIS